MGDSIDVGNLCHIIAQADTGHTSTLSIPLLNGGTGGAVFVFLGTALGMGMVILSMAEMASMAPTSGGQYHWVSEFAPREYQKFLSYVVGG
jgi:amino acid transporter